MTKFTKKFVDLSEEVQQRVLEESFFGLYNEIRFEDGLDKLGFTSDFSVQGVSFYISGNRLDNITNIEKGPLFFECYFSEAGERKTFNWPGGNIRPTLPYVEEMTVSYDLSQEEIACSFSFTVSYKLLSSIKNQTDFLQLLEEEQFSKEVKKELKKSNFKRAFSDNLLTPEEIDYYLLEKIKLNKGFVQELNEKITVSVEGYKKMKRDYPKKELAKRASELKNVFFTEQGRMTLRIK